MKEYKPCKQYRPKKPLETFDGHACVKCGATTRYVSTKKCVACRRATKQTPRHKSYLAHWRKVNGPKSRRMHKYGITPETFDLIFAEQGGCCAICKVVLDRVTRKTIPNVDHSHVTNKVRGILCLTCNVLLGNVQDDPKILKEAILYLEKQQS
jgi:hypothetical protein